MFKFHKNYMEFFFVVLAALGIIIALLTPSPAISYIMILIAGLFAGRVIFERKEKIKFPYIVIMAGYLIGFILGIFLLNYLREDYHWNIKLVIVLFIIGAILGYKAYDKGWLRDI